MGRYDSSHTADDIRGFEKANPWVKDLSMSDLLFDYEGSQTQSFVRIKGGVVFGGVIKDFEWDNCAIRGIKSSRVKISNMATSKSKSLNDAKSICDVTIKGGIFNDVIIYNCIIVGGTFNHAINIVSSVVIMDDTDRAEFTGIRGGHVFQMSSCYIDEVTNRIIEGFNSMCQLKLMGCTINSFVLDDNMHLSKIKVVSCTVNKGINVQDRISNFEFVDCELHKFTSLQRNKVRLKLQDCEIHDSELVFIELKGDLTKVYNTSCTDCNIIGMQTVITKFNLEKLDGVQFINSSWDGGTFRGVFNMDSTWLSGEWDNGVDWMDGTPRLDCSMFGWTENKMVTMDGKSEMKQVIYGLPSMESPKDNPEFFKLMKKISKARESFSLVYTESMKVLMNNFRKLCGAKVDYRESPITHEELDAMGELTDSDKELIRKSISIYNE